MQINGKKFDTPAIQIIPIIMGDETIILKAQCIIDYSKFEAMCPAPKPPTVQKPGSQPIPNFEDKKYIEKMGKFAEKKTAFMILESLKATEGLTWDTIDYSNPETWDNYLEELKKCFSEIQCTQIISGVMTANGLDSERIEQARKDFLAGTRVQPESLSSQKEEPSST